MSETLAEHAPFRIIRGAPPLRLPKYPFADLQPGDAFDMPRDRGSTPDGLDRRMANIRTAANAWAKRHNPDARFSLRCIDEHTVRCRRDA